MNTKRSTRERIVDMALEMFNAQGTRAVSTNHVADALGISRGNLHYHFKNKEIIIRCLFARYAQATDNVWSTTEAPGLAQFEGILQVLMQRQWEYRFLYRELLALLQRDEELALAYREYYRLRQSEVRHYLHRLRNADLIRADIDDDALDDTMCACWLVHDNWVTHLDIAGEPVSPATMQQGIRVFVRVLWPALSARGRDMLQNMLGLPR